MIKNNSLKKGKKNAIFNSTFNLWKPYVQSNLSITSGSLEKKIGRGIKISVVFIA